MEINKPKSIFKQFLGKIANLKTSTSQINKSQDSKAQPFQYFLDTNKVFAIDKDLSKTTADLVKELGITNEVPEFAKDLNLEPGIYSFGTGTNEEVDIENESVEIANEVWSNLTKAPYNKVFQAHDKKAIASGVIQFAGVVNGDKKLLEKLNEAHPEFVNIAGSIQNHSLDSYSVSGQASKELVFDKGLGRNITKRKVIAAHEVSRTSCPVNAGSKIDGLFFVKSKAGGYAYSQEDSKMEDTNVQAIQKIVTDSMTEVVKSVTDLSGKFDGVAERLGVVETFTKSLKEEAANLNKAETDGEEKPKEETKEDPVKEESKEETKEEAKPEEVKDDTKEEVKKSSVEERLSLVEKSLPAPSKAIAKLPTQIKKSVSSPMLNHAISGSGYLGGN